MTQVEDFISQQTGEPQRIMQYLHNVLGHDLGLVDKIRYRIPFYYHKSWICYINPIKHNGVELAFLRGNELSNEQGILDFKGRKQVAGIELRTFSEIPRAAIYEIIQEALILDEIKPYTSKRIN
jgi:hypothetical protein